MRRSKLRLALAGCLLIGVAAVASSQSRPAPPAFPAGVELVRLDVVVLGRDGKPATGLTAADFEVKEGGRARSIETFEAIELRPRPTAPEPAEPARVSVPRVLAPEEGRCYLIFFDDVHVGPVASEWVRKQLAPFLEREVKEGDWVTIVAPEGDIWWTARTPWEHRQLPALVRRLSGQLVRNPFKDKETDYAAMQLVEYGSRTGAEPASRDGSQGGGPPDGMIAEMVYAAAQGRIRTTLEALLQAIESMAGFRGRKTLFLYSEGFIRAPALEHVFQPVIDAARRANVAVQFVAPQGLSSGLMDASGNQSCGHPMCLETEAGGSTYLAAATGGRVFLSNDVTVGIQTTLQESSAYYLLGFRPTGAKAGEHRVRVRVRRESLTVRARDRYFVARPAASNTPLAPAVTAARAVSDATDIPLRVSTLVGEPLPGGGMNVTVSIGLDPPREERQRRLSVLIVARRLQGGPPVYDQAEIRLPATAEPPTVDRPLPLDSGVWQARVVVTDLQTGALGSTVHTLEVP